MFHPQVVYGTTLAVFSFVEKKRKPLDCYIAAFHNNQVDPFLDNIGFSKGLISFAIPDFGILFRCRAEGILINLEFGVLFSLLDFYLSKLKDKKVNSVQVLSSNPEFIFSFTGNTKYLQPESPRRLLLEEYSKKLKISIGYIKPIDNKALISPADYPSLPDDNNLLLNYSNDELSKIDFKPFQTGIKL